MTSSLPRKLVILVGALLVFGGAFVLRDSGTRPDASDVARSTQPAQGALPRLVELGSDRCIPCKQMAPILDELRTEYRDVLVVEFIDVWKDPEAGEPYGVRVIPTQVFIDASGAERFRHEGFLAKDAILAKWEELGVTLTPHGAAVSS